MPNELQLSGLLLVDETEIEDPTGNDEGEFFESEFKTLFKKKKAEAKKSKTDGGGGPDDPFQGWDDSDYEAARKEAGLPDTASRSDIERFWDEKLLDEADEADKRDPLGKNEGYTPDELARRNAEEAERDRKRAQNRIDRGWGPAPGAGSFLCQRCNSNAVSAAGQVCDDCNWTGGMYD